MYMLPVHPFAAEARQQCGVGVDNVSAERLQGEGSEFFHISGEHNQIGLFIAKGGANGTVQRDRIRMSVPAEVHQFDPVAFRALSRSGLAVIADHHGNVGGQRRCLTGVYYALQGSPVVGG